MRHSESCVGAIPSDADGDAYSVRANGDWVRIGRAGELAVRTNVDKLDEIREDQAAFVVPEEGARMEVLVNAAAS